MSRDVTDPRVSPILTRPTPVAGVVILAALASSFVFLTSAVLQWAIYDDWMHRTGPFRLVGTSIAAVLTFWYLCKWMLAERARQTELLRRLEVIAEMNDRIRNAVQGIAFTSYVQQPEEAEHVRQAIETIDHALRGVIETLTPAKVQPQAGRTKAAAQRSKA